MKKGKLYRYLARILAAVFAVWLFPFGMEAKADPPAPYAASETPELHSFYYYSGAQDTLSATEPEKWWTKLEKYVRYRQESDTFRLTLRVQGNTVMTQTQAAPVVTVLVIDTSVNMGEMINYQSKLEHVRQAAKGYVDTVLSDEATGYVAVIGYDDYGYMPDGGYFSSDYDRVIDMIDSLEVNSEGYPNTQGGLIAARWVLQALKGVDAETIENPATTYNVVFLSEGTPSAYYTGDLSWLTDASIHGDDYESFASDAYAAMEAYEDAHDTYTLGYYEYEQWHPGEINIWTGQYGPDYYTTEPSYEEIEKVWSVSEDCTQAVKVQSNALKQILAARGRVFSVGYTDGSGTYLEIGSDADYSFDANESSLGQVYQSIALQHVAGETGDTASVCDAAVTDEIPDGFTVTDYGAVIVKEGVEAAYIAGDPVFSLVFGEDKTTVTLTLPEDLSADDYIELLVDIRAKEGTFSQSEYDFVATNLSASLLYNNALTQEEQTVAFPVPQVYIPPQVTATIHIEKTILQPDNTGADMTFQAALYDGQKNRIGDAVSVSEGNPASMTFSVKQELGIGNEPKTFYLQETGLAPESWTYDQTAYPVTIYPDGTVFNGALPDAEPNDEAHPIVLTNVYAPTADLTIINSGDDGPEGTRFTYCVTIGGVIQECFSLGSGECRTFAAVPVGTSYCVAEEPDERYETTGSGTIGVIDIGGNTVGFSHIFITYNLTITSRTLTDKPLGDMTYEYILRLSDDYGVLPPASAQYDEANDAYRFELVGGDSLTFQHIPRLSEYVVMQIPDLEAGGNYQIWVKEDTDSKPVNAAAYSGRISGNRNITFTNQYLSPSQLSISKAVIKGIEVPGYRYGFLIELWTLDDEMIVPFTDGQGLLPQWLCITDTPGTYAFTLEEGQSAALSDLPIGLHYLITEPEEGSGGVKDTVIAINGAAVQDARGIISHDIGGDDAAVVVFFNDFSVETGRITVENPIDDPHGRYAGQAFSYEAIFTEPVTVEPYCAPVETDEGYLYAFSLEAGDKAAFTDLHEGTAYTVREIDIGGADEVSVSGGEMHDQTGISVSGVMKRSGFNVLDEGLQFTHRYNPYVLSMQLSKSVRESRIYAGEAARYTIALHNAGEYPASQVYLMDTVFSELEKERISVSITSGASGQTSALSYGDDYDFTAFVMQSLEGQAVPNGVYLVLSETVSLMPGDTLTVSYDIAYLLPGQYLSSVSAICLFAPLEEILQSTAEQTSTVQSRPSVVPDKYTVTVAYYEERTNNAIRQANTLTDLVCGQHFNIESCGFIYDKLGDYRLSGASAAYSGIIGGSDVLICLYYEKSVPDGDTSAETPGQSGTGESPGSSQTPDMPQSESTQDDVTAEESVPDSKIPAALPETGGIMAGWPALIGAAYILAGVILSGNKRKGKRKGQ